MKTDREQPVKTERTVAGGHGGAATGRLRVSGPAVTNARVGARDRWIAVGLAVIALAACDGAADGVARAVTTKATPVVAAAKLGTSETVNYTFDQTTSKTRASRTT